MNIKLKKSKSVSFGTQITFYPVIGAYVYVDILFWTLVVKLGKFKLERGK